MSMGLLASFSGCDSHRLDEPLYYFKNETAGVVYVKLSTKGNAGDVTFGSMYALNEELTMSGGGHFTLDSIITRKTIINNSVLMVTDSIIYRNPKFGDDITPGNHYFNPKKVATT